MLAQGVDLARIASKPAAMQVAVGVVLSFSTLN